MIESRLPIHFFPSNTSLNLFLQQKLRFVLEELHDSFFAINLTQVLKNLSSWTNIFPYINPYINLSPNYDAFFLKCLGSFDVGYICHSNSEINMLPSSNNWLFDAKLLMNSYIKNVKSHNGVLTFTNIDEFIKITSMYPEAQLMMKLNINEYVCKGSAALVGYQLLLEKMLAIKGKAHILGIYFCDYSSSHQYSIPWDDLMKFMFQTIILFWNNFKNDIKQPHVMLDIKGLFNMNVEDLKEVSQKFGDFLVNFTQQYGLTITISAQINEYILDHSAWSLVTPIIKKSGPIKSMDSRDDKLCIFINNSVYDVFMNLIVNERTNSHQFDIQPIQMEQASGNTLQKVCYNVFGNTGSFDDVIALNCEFDGELGNRDWLVINSNVTNHNSCNENTPVLSFNWHEGMKTLYFADADHKNLLNTLLTSSSQNKMRDLFDENMLGNSNNRLIQLQNDFEDDYELEMCLSMLFTQDYDNAINESEALLTQFDNINNIKHQIFAL